MRIWIAFDTQATEATVREALAPHGSVCSYEEQEQNWRERAASDARDMVREFEDEIVAQILGSGEASDDYNNDYSGGDSYHHETHVDRGYRLLEAAGLLAELDHDRETDSGLWQGLDPEEVLAH